MQLTDNLFQLVPIPDLEFENGGEDLFIPELRLTFPVSGSSRKAKTALFVSSSTSIVTQPEDLFQVGHPGAGTRIAGSQRAMPYSRDGIFPSRRLSSSLRAAAPWFVEGCQTPGSLNWARMARGYCNDSAGMYMASVGQTPARRHTPHSTHSSWSIETPSSFSMMQFIGQKSMHSRRKCIFQDLSSSLSFSPVLEYVREPLQLAEDRFLPDLLGRFCIAQFLEGRDDRFVDFCEFIIQPGCS